MRSVELYSVTTRIGSRPTRFLMIAAILVTFIVGFISVYSALAMNVYKSGHLVSITGVDDEELFLTADYSNIYLFNRFTGRSEILPVSGGSRRNVPTGLAYDASTRRLFIANYTSNNILVGRIDWAQKKIIIEEEFGHDVAISPENIAVDPDSDSVAVANYDGEEIQIWSNRERLWTKTCSVPVNLAHGVTFANSLVFATSLGNRELVKINPSSCQVISRIGQIGWGNNQFLWPTHVKEWDDTHVAVSDAHTGKLTIHRQDDLRAVRSIGGNGPFALNMPYSFTRATDGEIILLSIFGSKIIGILELRLKIWKVFGDDYLPWNLSGSLNRRNWSLYKRTDKSVDFLWRCMQESYARLLACDGSLALQLPAPSETFVSEGSYYYFVEVSRLSSGWFLSSPQNNVAIYVREEDLRSAPMYVGYDAWQDGNRLFASGTSISMEGIEIASKGYLDDADRLIGSGLRSVWALAGFLPTRSSWIALASRIELNGPKSTDEERAATARFAEQISMRIVQSGLSEFLSANENCAATAACDHSRICQIAQMAARPLATSDSEVSLSALLMAAMLNPCVGRSFREASQARTPAEQGRLVSEGAHVTPETPFYQGHEPQNAFDGDASNNYVAARESTFPNSFRFDVRRRGRPTRLDLLWNSPREYATEFTLYGIGEDGRDEQIFAVSDNKPDAGGGNTYPIRNAKSYSRYRFVVSAAAGQDRLLLRGMSLFGEPTAVGATAR